jgi:hypothetical protein
MPRENAPVAQLDRALDYESRGQEFESLRARHHFNELAAVDGRRYRDVTGSVTESRDCHLAPGNEGERAQKPAEDFFLTGRRWHHKGMSNLGQHPCRYVAGLNKTRFTELNSVSS